MYQKQIGNEKKVFLTLFNFKPVAHSFKSYSTLNMAGSDKN